MNPATKETVMTLEHEMTRAVPATPDRTARQYAFGMEQVMLEVVRGIVEEVDWPGKESGFSALPGTASSAKVLMRALIYAMATGVDHPFDLPRALTEDSNFQRLSDGCPLDAQTLQAFSRRYRPALERCLAKLFERTVLVRFGDDFDESILADSCVALAWDCWFESLHVPARFCWQSQLEPAAQPVG